MNKQLKNLLNNGLIELSARWILGIIFIYASYHKIMSPAEFAKIIYGYDLFPNILINLFAIILPSVELFIGFALILGIYPRSAVLIANSMLLAFIIALSTNLIRGHEFDCGCFSSGKAGGRFSVELLLVRDVIFFIIGLQVFLFDGHRRLSISGSRSIPRV